MRLTLVLSTIFTATWPNGAAKAARPPCAFGEEFPPLSKTQVSPLQAKVNVFLAELERRGRGFLLEDATEIITDQLPEKFEVKFLNELLTSQGFSCFRPIGQISSPHFILRSTSVLREGFAYSLTLSVDVMSGSTATIKKSDVKATINMKSL